MYTLAHTHVCVCMLECVYTHTPRGNVDHPQPSSGSFSSQGHWRNFGITCLPYAIAVMVQHSRTAL